MPITILEHVEGSEIPSSWKKDLKAEPNQSFKVILEPLEEKKEQMPQKGKWADFAKKMQTKSPLKDASEDANKVFREFRDNFDLKLSSLKAMKYLLDTDILSYLGDKDSKFNAPVYASRETNTE